ncbi:MAG: DNA repair protein RecN [Calditrichaeota bacterium]|nr:MAG: DNA repair protein RecN [Calditrichota bacterium]
MLKYLKIRHFALADDLAIEFQPGLNILTGETGAGKSILVGAIAAVLGERVYTEVIRTGSDKAMVQAVFDIQHLPELAKLLQEKGIETGDELYLRREVFRKGNSRAFINDIPVTVNTLAEVGDYLMDIHGQHTHQSLLKRDTHRQFLDTLGKLSPLLNQVSEAYTEVKSRFQQLNELLKRKEELESQYELFQFQYKEIEDAGLTPGEDEELEKERHLLMNLEKIFEVSAKLNELFSEGEVNLLEMTAEAERRLEELAGYSDELEKIAEEFSSARIVLEESARSVQEFASRLEFDPQRLEEVEQRLSLIERLKKKYGATIEEILNHQQQLKQSLELRENFDFEIQELKKEYQDALTVFRDRVRQLSQQRAVIAREIEEKMEANLIDLGMPKTRFQVRLSKQEDPAGLFEEDGKTYFADQYGVDQVEFFISPNPGEDFKPLAKIASGGEISRIMLALKSILAENDRIPTLVFDEIDSGVSGRIARAVGRSIQQLSNSHQILCITHLPQIASYGTSHFSVEKYVEDGRTFTRIVPLTEEERIEEVARLMAGEKVSDMARESARQLIEEGKAEGASQS